MSFHATILSGVLLLLSLPCLAADANTAPPAPAAPTAVFEKLSGLDLPDGPTAVAEDRQGRLYFGVAGKDGRLACWDGKAAKTLESGDVGGIAVHPDGSVWYTLGRTVCSIDAAGAKKDRTAEFGGSPAGARRVYCGVLGEVWAEGCPKMLGPDANSVECPPCPLAGPAPAPYDTDHCGNFWSLVRPQGLAGKAQIVGLLAGSPCRWSVLAKDEDLPAGNWDCLLADRLHFLWVAGKDGLMRFNGTKPSDGWADFRVKETLKDEVASLGQSPDFPPLAGTAGGAVYVVDFTEQGKPIAQRFDLKGLPGKPVRAVHTDRDGAVLAVSGGAVYRAAPAAGAWQKHWALAGRLPYGDHDAFGDVLGGKFYIAGGMANHALPSKQANFDSLFIFDFATGRVSMGPPMAAAMCYSGVSAMDGKIWVLGGGIDVHGARQATDMVQIYDPNADKWKPGPLLDEPLMESVTVVAGGRLYVIGGADRKNTPISAVWSIDPNEKTWRREPNAPVKVRQASGCLLDGIVYIPLNTGLVSFDPAAGTWDANLPKLPDGPGISAALTAAHKGEVWVIGGYGKDMLPAARIYSPKTRQWRMGPPIPNPMGWVSAADVGGKLYLFTGAFGARNLYIFTDTIWMLRD